VDSETNSNRDSNFLVPKLSGSDLTSFINDGHDCSIIEEDKNDKEKKETDIISSKGKPLVWYERLHSNEVELKHKPISSNNMLNVIKEDAKSEYLLMYYLAPLNKELRNNVSTTCSGNF
jgi:predicted Mrr-cat superfamily restriction endonuclease